MSYSLELAPEAMANLAALEPWLQEVTLDQIEWATANGEKLLVRGLRPGAVVDLAQDSRGSRYYVFIVVDVDHASRHLKVTKIVPHVESL